MTDTKSRLAKIVREHLMLDRDPADGDQIISDLGADSLDMIELIMAAEEDLGCSIPDGRLLEKADLTFGEFVEDVEKARSDG